IRTGSTLRGALLAPVEDIGLLAPMAIGALAARVRLLEEVAANRDVLVPLTRWGLGLGLLGAVPLTAVLVLDPAHAVLAGERLLGMLGVLHQLSGLLGALGLAAAAALLAERVRRREAAGVKYGELLRGRAERSIEALGAVSLSAYVAQSLVFLALFPPFALDLGSRLGTASAAGIVLLSWLAMLPLAAAL